MGGREVSWAGFSAHAMQARGHFGRAGADAHGARLLATHRRALRSRAHMSRPRCLCGLCGLRHCAGRPGGSNVGFGARLPRAEMSPRVSRSAAAVAVAARYPNPEPRTSTPNPQPETLKLCRCGGRLRGADCECTAPCFGKRAPHAARGVSHAPGKHDAVSSHSTPVVAPTPPLPSPLRCLRHCCRNCRCRRHCRRHSRQPDPRPQRV